MLCYVMLCYVMSCYVMLCYSVLSYVIKVADDALKEMLVRLRNAS